MGKAKRVDLGGIKQERTNKEYYGQPRYNQSQPFYTKPGGQTSTKRIALGALRGVNIDTPATDDALVFDGSYWIATPQSGTGSSGISLPVTMPVHDFGTVTTSTISHSFAETSAHVMKMILSTDTTLTFTNIPSQHIEFELDVTQDSTGGYALNFDSTSISLSSTPTVQQSATKETILIGQTHGISTTTCVFHIFDTALKSGSGSGGTSTAYVASWSIYPAIQDVDMASNSLTGTEGIYFRNGKMNVYGTTGDSLQFQTTTSGSFNYYVGDTSRFGLYTSSFEVSLGSSAQFLLQINGDSKFAVTDSIFYVAMTTNSTIQLLHANELQRMYMNNTNTVFQIPDAGGFVVQSSSTATDLISIGPNAITADSNLTLTTNSLLTIQKSMIIVDSQTHPGTAGEFRNVSDDVLVYSGGATRNISNIGNNPTAAVASWSVYPAIQTVDMASFNIDNLTVLYGSGPNVQSFAFSTSAITANYIGGGQIAVNEGATNVCQFISEGLNMASNDIDNIGIAKFYLGAQLAGITSDMTYNVGSGFQHQIQIAGTPILTVDATTSTIDSILDMNLNDIVNVDNMSFEDPTQLLQTGPAGITWVAPSNDVFQVKVGDTTGYQQEDDRISLALPLLIAPYTNSTRPSAASYPRAIIWNSSDSAYNYSDGSNWRLMPTGSVT